jgi:hypothetical protein
MSSHQAVWQEENGGDSWRVTNPPVPRPVHTRRRHHGTADHSIRIAVKSNLGSIGGGSRRMVDTAKQDAGLSLRGTESPDTRHMHGQATAPCMQGSSQYVKRWPNCADMCCVRPTGTAADWIAVAGVAASTGRLTRASNPPTLQTTSKFPRSSPLLLLS